MGDINFGVIGLGNRGSKFTLNSLLTRTEINVVMVCDKQGTNFSEFTSRGIETVTDYKKLLHSKTIDAVYIASPDDTHAAIVLEAIKSGKHIICEKPLAIKISDLNQIKQSLSNYNKVFQTGYVLRYSPIYYRAKRLVNDGLIGKIVMANSIDHINYGGYAFFHDWHRKKENVNTLLLQKATHSLDIVNWIVDAKPIEVVGMGGLSVFGKQGGIDRFNNATMDDLHCNRCKYKYECEESLISMKRNQGIEWSREWPDRCVFSSEINVDDHQTLMIKYDNATEATYMLCQFAGHYKREFQFFGSKGELFFDDANNKLCVHFRNSAQTLEYVSPVLKGHGGGDDELIDDFLRCIQTKNTPRSNAENAIEVGKLALVAQSSIEQQNVLTI
ncbi:MAG: Gfo/Idh/MocA family oxidoreductase [Sporolactobacillus sp.]|jgi:predicted dehydrogenase|nr:Gfo/Idh/MocA family oxidoreductase [Sporolactobacillus sp.]